MVFIYKDMFSWFLSHLFFSFATRWVFVVLPGSRAAPSWEVDHLRKELLGVK